MEPHVIPMLFLYSCSVMSDSTTPWTIAHQALLSTGFPRQESWNGLPFPFPRDLPDQVSNPHLLHWQEDSLLISHQGNSCNSSTLLGNKGVKFKENCQHTSFFGILPKQLILTVKENSVGTTARSVGLHKHSTFYGKAQEVKEHRTKANYQVSICLPFVYCYIY